MRRLLISIASGIVLLAGGALAGEVKGPPSPGNTNETAAPANANSDCAYSGLNDNIVGEGQIESQVQTAADSWKFYGLPKGSVGTFGLCKGGTNLGRER